MTDLQQALLPYAGVSVKLEDDMVKDWTLDLAACRSDGGIAHDGGSKKLPVPCQHLTMGVHTASERFPTVKKFQGRPLNIAVGEWPPVDLGEAHTAT